MADSSVPVPYPLINKVTKKTSVTIGGLVSGTGYFLYVYALKPAGAMPTPAVFFSTKPQ